MTKTYFNSFIMCFIIINIGVLKIDYTDSAENFDYQMMKELLTNTKSVWVNGNKINLEEWLQNEDLVSTKISNLNAKIMYTLVKCESAHLISHIVEYILYNITKEMMATKLELLSEDIKRVISMLFHIRYHYPSLQSTEPYFMKTLLMTSFYVDGVTSARNDIDNGTKLKYGNFRILPSHTLNYMVRVLLQIVNLFENFTFEHCFPSKDNNTARNLEDHLKKLHEFLDNIVSFNTVPSYKEIDMDSIKLKSCMQNNVLNKKNHSLVSFCDRHLKVAYIEESGFGKVNIETMFNRIAYSYEIAHIYEYMLVVFKIIMKILYILTSEVWNSGQSLDTTWCNDQILKLKSLGCPVEMINNFELAISVENHRNFIKADTFRAEDYFRSLKLFDGFDWKLDKEKLTHFSLQDLMASILDDEFKNFWWTLNVLYKESATKSKFVYDTSLDYFPVNFGMQTDKCEFLMNVYQNSLYTTKNNSNICNLGGNEKSTTECGSRVFELSTQLSEYLLRILKKLVEDNIYTSNYGDLHKIVLAMIINLQKDFIEKKVVHHHYYGKNRIKELENIVMREREIFNRILHLFMNVLDNYQIKNCKIHNLRNSFNPLMKSISKSKSFSGPLSTPDRNTMLEKLRDLLVPHNFYNLDTLTASANDVLKCFVKDDTYFDWHGEMKSVFDIFNDIKYDMLNIRDLVEYQQLYSNWLIYSFYRMWHILFEEMTQKHNGTIQFVYYYNKAMECLYKFDNNLFSALSQSYFTSKTLVHQIFQPHSISLSNDIVGIAETEIIGPIIRLFGVLEGIQLTKDHVNEFCRANKTYSFTNDESFVTLYSLIEDNAKEILSDFIFKN